MSKLSMVLCLGSLFVISACSAMKFCADDANLTHPKDPNDETQNTVAHDDLPQFDMWHNWQQFDVSSDRASLKKTDKDRDLVDIVLSNMSDRRLARLIISLFHSESRVEKDDYLQKIEKKLEEIFSNSQHQLQDWDDFRNRQFTGRKSNITSEEVLRLREKYIEILNERVAQSYTSKWFEPVYVKNLPDCVMAVDQYKGRDF